jgi:hypothetical protein
MTFSSFWRSKIEKLDKRLIAVEDQIPGLQPLDADTTAIAALSGAGFAYRVSDGVWQVRNNPIVFATPQATTSGTSIDFTGIPAGTNRITMGFSGVSTNGTSIPMIQIGDSGGIETSGYTGSATNFSTAPTIASVNHSAGWQLTAGWAATAVASGFITLTRYSASNQWMISGVLGRTDAVANMIVAGFKTLSATLDRVRLTTVGGANTFDVGEVNISYE